MALNTEKIVGHQLDVTASGDITDWQDFGITITDNTSDATGSDSTQDEVVVETERLELECSGFLGSANNGGTLPAKGDLITDLAVKVGADSVLPNISRFSNIRITEVKYDFKKGPANFSFKARSGVLNRVNGVDA